MIEPCSFTVHEHQVLFFGSCVLFQEVRACEGAPGNWVLVKDFSLSYHSRELS